MGNKTSLFERWSYSSWSLGRKCGYALKLSYLDKIKQPPNRAMDRGIMIHSLAEHYLKGSLTGGVPKPLQKLTTEYKALKKLKPPIIEQYWGVSPSWKPMDYGWCTAKTDVALPPTKKENILITVDHKSGKEYKDHWKQGSLYSAIGFALYPRIDLAVAEFFYVDQGKAVPYEFTRAQLRYSVRYWMEQGKEFMARKKFLPQPSFNACQYCGYRSDKKLASGKPGPCTAWKIVRGI